MTAPHLCLAMLAVLLLIGQIRVGVQVEYQSEGLFAWARLGTFRVPVFPLKKKEGPDKKRKKAKKPKKEKAPKPLGEKAGGALDYARELLPIALEAAGMFYHRLRMDTLKLELTVGSDDPADTAMRYGQASAILGSFWYPLTDAFHVKDGHAKVNLDFDAKERTLYAAASLSLKLGQVLWLGIYIGVRALKGFLAVSKKQKNENVRKAA